MTSSLVAKTYLLLVEVRGGCLSSLGYTDGGYGSADVTYELLADIVNMGVSFGGKVTDRRFRMKREDSHGFSAVS